MCGRLGDNPPLFPGSNQKLPSVTACESSGDEVSSSPCLTCYFGGHRLIRTASFGCICFGLIQLRKTSRASGPSSGVNHFRNPPVSATHSPVTTFFRNPEQSTHIHSHRSEVRPISSPLPILLAQPKCFEEMASE